MTMKSIISLLSGFVAVQLSGFVAVQLSGFVAVLRSITKGTILVSNEKVPGTDVLSVNCGNTNNFLVLKNPLIKF
ncbi:MAG: hypothetical protein AN484_18835 [Aphanizomenon flos-aquae WA102]|uniref:Uncharacterized protein n=1 Tax=Aphanizomenon flos-aquae WA102 TaxID=1710896 RepID=A0A1B7WYQ9_APHFL|nr:MAG: hypothetical protein AN484_18835 [Aphanizomenon flos-aquae WA102]